jgi:hypothetical protein
MIEVNMVKSSVIKAILKKSPNPLWNTFLWATAPQQVKDQFSFEVSTLDLNEEPICCFIGIDYSRWMMTDKRLVQNANVSIYYEEVLEIDIDDTLNAHNSKREVDVMAFRLKNGRLQLNIELGTWPTMHNIWRYVLG